MSRDDENTSTPPAIPQAKPADVARKHRLAVALRENLKRRKVQARARSGRNDGPSPREDGA